jgi:DNA polymerase-3 subunit epsilon
MVRTDLRQGPIGANMDILTGATLKVPLKWQKGFCMKLRKAIISILDRDSIKGICRYYEAEVDYRSKESMAQYLLRRRSILPQELFEFLKEPQVKAVCEACGMVSTGRRGKLIEKLLRIERGPTFVALDFETADNSRDSACALALVRVENHQIVQRTYNLIKPPRQKFLYTNIRIHGITWEDVADQPTFGELWPTFSPMLEGIDFLAAHNASFDRSVLQKCCKTAGLTPPALPFQCTVRLARQTWDIFPTKLNDVCDHLGITLKHHHAASDAEACALIVIAAHQISPK